MPMRRLSSSRVTTSIYALLVALSLVFLHPLTTRSLAQGDAVLFGDTLDPAFQNWPFATTVNLAASSPTYGGSSHAIAVTYQSGNWGALWLVRPGGDMDLSGYTALRFAVHGGAHGGQQIRVHAGSGAVYPSNNFVDLNNYLPGGPVANEWRVVTIPLTDLNLAGGSLGSIAFQSTVNSGQPTFFLDDIRLIAGSEPTPPPSISATIQIQTGGNQIPISRYLLSANLPAWLGPQEFANQTLRAYTVAAGIRVLRLPGGSWSNEYGWLSCELGQDQPGALPCRWPWAARPSDFISFLKATNTEGIWVVSPNGTSKEAAALVAFFNGDVNDNRPIGVDIRGVDWRTVGYWAQLRAARGHPEPVGIKLWEFGNEVYGSKPATGGALCQPWGWEEVWTCDGTEYVHGKGSGSQRREGYLEFRAAMRAVDPTILVGAVGFEIPGSPQSPSWQNYNSWGSKVIAAAGDKLDFYAIHPYPYSQAPANNATGHAEILAKPQTHLRTIRTDLNAAFDAFAGGRRAPVAITEYNLVAVQDQDNPQFMTRAINALFLADSIGQAIQQGYMAFSQWALANGRAGNGTEYGLVHRDNNFYRAPQYYVYPLWSRFGSVMLPVVTSLDPAAEAAVYAGRVNDTTLSLLVINKTGRVINAAVSADDAAIGRARLYEVRATSPTAQSVTYNGVSTPSAALNEPPRELQATADSKLTVTLAPWSISLLHLETASGGTSAGLRLAPTSATLIGQPGEAVTYTLTVTNTDQVMRTYTVAVSGNNWPTTVPATVGPLTSGASATFQVVVTIPDSTAGAHVDNATITVTAQDQNEQSAQAVLTTIRARHRLFVPVVTAMARP